MNNYLTLLSELKKYYSNLLIVQYNGKPRAKATIELMVDLIFAGMILLQIRDAFEWQTAIGNQLDIIGQWVGVTRTYNAQLYNFRPWFSLIDWDKNPTSLQGGFSTFENFNTLKGGFLTYDDIQPTQGQLKDDNYRILVGLKIIKNNISHTAKAIDEAIWEYFNHTVYTVWDLENKELIYYYPSALSTLMQIAKDKNILPCPPPVSIRIEEIN